MDIMMPEMDGYETMRPIREIAGVQAAADHRADGQGDEGRPREVHRRRARPTTSPSRSTPTSCSRCMRVWLYRLRPADEPAPGARERRCRTAELERLEIELLLEAIYRRYGFDFRELRAGRRCGGGSGGASTPRGCATISALQERVLHDPPCMERLLLDLSINVTAMFRDPTFFLAFREKVVPLLRTYPFVRIWHAGCSTGEEVYSLAILLAGGGALRPLAASTPPTSTRPCCEQARDGHLPARDDAGVHAELHQRRAARASFSRVLHGGLRRRAFFDRRSRENVVFAQHNLVTDRVVQRVQRHPLPQRDDLLRHDAAGPRARRSSTRASTRSASSRSGSKESIRFTPFADALRGARRATSGSTGRSR